jgi:hypothetical protein
LGKTIDLKNTKSHENGVVNTARGSISISAQKASLGNRAESGTIHSAIKELQKDRERTMSKSKRFNNSIGWGNANSFLSQDPG